MYKKDKKGQKRTNNTYFTQRHIGKDIKGHICTIKGHTWGEKGQICPAGTQIVLFMERTKLEKGKICPSGTQICPSIRYTNLYCDFL